MPCVQLVILAAGHGRRFGGLKQLAPVGPNREAIMDYTAGRAEACGFDGIVLVVREEIRDEIVAHVERVWSLEIPVAFVCQAAVPGTAQAVYSARPALDGAFAVANADDLYSEEALRALVDHFRPAPSAALEPDAVIATERAETHLVVGHRLVRTILTNEPVTRGLLDVDADGRMRRIVEHTVQLRDDGTFDATVLGRGPKTDRLTGPARHLSGDEPVSMNLWAFGHTMLDRIGEALASFDQANAPHPELLLPDVIGALVSDRSEVVKVVEIESRCIGITHPNDIDLVREEIETQTEGAPSPEAARPT